MTLLWKIGGAAVVLLAAYFLVTTYGGARYKQGKSDSDVAWSMKVIEAEKGKLAAYQAGVASVQRSEIIYHETVEKLVPITKTIIERAKDYAQTTDGSALCLPAERVHLLDETRSALFPASGDPDARRGAETVPPYPARDTTGRIDDARRR